MAGNGGAYRWAAGGSLHRAASVSRRAHRGAGWCVRRCLIQVAAVVLPQVSGTDLAVDREVGPMMIRRPGHHQLVPGGEDVAGDEAGPDALRVVADRDARDGLRGRVVDDDDLVV